MTHAVFLERSIRVVLPADSRVSVVRREHTAQRIVRERCLLGRNGITVRRVVGIRGEHDKAARRIDGVSELPRREACTVLLRIRAGRYGSGRHSIRDIVDGAHVPPSRGCEGRVVSRRIVGPSLNLPIATMRDSAACGVVAVRLAHPNVALRVVGRCVRDHREEPPFEVISVPRHQDVRGNGLWPELRVRQAVRPRGAAAYDRVWPVSDIVDRPRARTCALELHGILCRGRIDGGDVERVTPQRIAIGETEEAEPRTRCTQVAEYAVVIERLGVGERRGDRRQLIGGVVAEGHLPRHVVAGPLPLLIPGCRVIAEGRDAARGRRRRNDLVPLRIPGVARIGVPAVGAKRVDHTHEVGEAASIVGCRRLQSIRGDDRVGE